MNVSRIIHPLLLAACLTCMPVTALAIPTFSNIFGFGDSVTDSGNGFILTSGAVQPVPFGGLIPSATYAGGRATNDGGPVWIETVASRLGLSAAPSLSPTGGTNFAIGGARIGTGATSLLNQVDAFLSATGGFAPSDALYVVWGGGNDARDAVAQAFADGNLISASNTIAQAISDTEFIINALVTAGASQIMVPNIPNLAQTPSAQFFNAEILAAEVSNLFNTALAALLNSLASPTVDFIELDISQLFSDLIAEPAAFGFTNVTDPCVNVASVCTTPNDFLFYDGIHPSAAGHAEIARFALAALGIPEPTSLALLTIGLLCLFWCQRRYQLSGRWMERKYENNGTA